MPPNSEGPEVLTVRSQSRLAYLCLSATREGQASYAHVLEMIHGLERRGWTVSLYEPRYRSSAKGPRFLARLLQFVLTQLRLWLSERPNILYIRWHPAAWPTAVWARLLRVPVVQEVNGLYEDVFLAWPWTRWFARGVRALGRTQLRWANAVIAVTPGLAEWVRKTSGNPRVCVVPNGANTELFVPTARSDLQPPDDFVVFLGALAPWQGLDTMLAAVADDSWPARVKLVILGDGPERPKVERAVLRGDPVEYLGVIPYSQVPEIVARSIAGLSVQNNAGRRSETGLAPLKVFETLACGVPVIVTDFPGQAELVRAGRCGVVIPPDDPRALAQAVEFLHRHAEERVAMGQRGRELVVREHSWDRRAEETDLVLRSVQRDE